MTIAAPPFTLRGIYEIRSRNLLIGVYDGNGGMIGIREKFGDRYLFTEYFYQPPWNGTVTTVGRRLGTVDPRIPLWTYTPPWCKGCGTPALYRGRMAPTPWECGGGCIEPLVVTFANAALYETLTDYAHP